MARHARTAVLVTFALGCSGTIGGTDGDDLGAPRAPGGARNDPQPSAAGDVSSCGAVRAAVPPGLARMLTPKEYVNTVRDLVGEAAIDADALPTPALFQGFDNNAASQVANESTVPQYLAAARSIAARVSAKIAALSACDARQRGEETCARELVAGFGKRAFRRPLTAGEQASLLAGYQAARKAGDYTAALTLTLEALLASPQFLFRFETSTAFREGDLIRLDDYETASRLSYLLWDRMPDAELFAAADAKRLGTAEQVAAQARRMVADARARLAVDDFHDQWLRVEAVRGAAKDAKLFPKFNAGVAASMADAAARFVEHVFWEEGGRLGPLFTATYGFRTDALAAFLGEAPPRSTTMTKVPLPPAERSGFLTDPGLLTFLAKETDTDVVNRGRFVFEHFLCEEIPEPPAGLDTSLGKPPSGTPPTKRDLFAQHQRDAVCAGCHKLLDPIGLAFENYDAVGKFRAKDAQGRPIDAAGELPQHGLRPFQGAVELGAQLAAAPGVRACVARQWFRYAMGRAETEEDRCTIESLAKRLEPNGPGAQEMLIALTQSPAFRYRSAP